MLEETPIWDRDGDWLAARAAVAKRLEARRLLLSPDGACSHVEHHRKSCVGIT